MANNSIKKTLMVALALCIVCSVVVSTAAVVLQPMQERNKELDRKTNILAVAELYEPGMDVGEAFKRLITPRVIKLETGEYTDRFDPQQYNQFEAAKDPAMSRTLSGEDDGAGIGREELYSTVYLVGDPEDPRQIILPIRGQGLWGLMRGFLALKGDGNTIIGLSYYSHSETPGLGAQVDNPDWKAQWDGKEVYADAGMKPEISLVKGGAESKYEVDALSGATLTSRGVTNMLHFWLSESGFGPYLARFHGNSEGA
ncbi:Na+-transporting NADH:ubiquinone oxidoreductase subunit C [Chromohalobacter marismortui]|uniref:Na(+)-translocating NADH-quinone reductase subunit C n=1 Tax=Chromohalobacter marismortui TaxID=42055 RepID=A0A4R7NW34_9GAMM|nr:MULTISPECIES: Na(+)-translocating NADH-quinone reductase subunit C [Chromohalobacter]MCI0510402.1 Na(+)-translocating NADH-quinone reductase subunit C [Chromohalobacter sp.]MCI0594713.1 Na(+)-translocating NADH-quinone reductase subunit C [Chromohalobacter sp.]TDU25022.1 Na+-transporting NADH:ubiquinone oxidoreductase subunit C [Chromohalobacter marismortui]